MIVLLLNLFGVSEGINDNDPRYNKDPRDKRNDHSREEMNHRPQCTINEMWNFRSINSPSDEFLWDGRGTPVLMNQDSTEVLTNKQNNHSKRRSEARFFMHI